MDGWMGDQVVIIVIPETKPQLTNYVSTAAAAAVQRSPARDGHDKYTEVLCTVCMYR